MIMAIIVRREERKRELRKSVKSAHVRIIMEKD